MVVNINTNAPRTKKFWCHYNGRDGNTPKRRSIELTNLESLMPCVGDTQHCPTPLWYEKIGQHYHVYAQLSDNVAIQIVGKALHEDFVKIINRTDDEIDAHWKAREENDEDWVGEGEANVYAKRDKETRDLYKAQFLESVLPIRDCDTYLLTSAPWITNSTLRAYEEVNSPILSTLQSLRKVFVAQREEEVRKREERIRKMYEEEKRKKAERKAEEYDRLTKEAEKFRVGESISGCDVVELCRRYDIGVHLRTVHNLQCVIVSINGNGTCRYYRSKGRRPVLDGCYLTASKLYDYLRKNEIY